MVGKIGEVWVGDQDLGISDNLGEEDKAGTLGTTYVEMMTRGRSVCLGN